MAAIPSQGEKQEFGGIVCHSSAALSLRMLGELDSVFG
jgi:hypothetical protein